MNYKKTPAINFSLILLLSLFSFSNPVFCEESLDTASEKKIERKIEVVQKSQNIDEETKLSISGTYEKTLSYLELIKETDKKIQFYINIQLGALEKIELLNKEIKEQDNNPQLIQPDDKTVLDNIKDIPITELEQQLETKLIQHSSISTKNTDVTQSLALVSKSLPRIRTDLMETNTLLEKKLQDKKFIPTDISSTKRQAIEWHTDTHIGLLHLQIEKLNKQLQSQPIRLKLLKFEKQLSDNDLKTSQFQLHLLKNKIKLKRELEIKRTQVLVQAEQIKAKGKHVLIQSMADKNAELNNEIINSLKYLNELESQNDTVNKDIKKLKLQQANTIKKLEIAGLNQILGQVLYEQKKALPNQQHYQENIIKRQNLIAQLGLAQIKYEEELGHIKNKEDYISHLFSDIPPYVQTTIYDDLMELIETRHALLDKAMQIDAQYLKAIGDVDYAEKLFLHVVNEYYNLLDEHLFWMRSAPILNWQNIKSIPEEVVFFLKPAKWSLFVNDFIKMVDSSLYISLLLLLVILFFFIRKHIINLLVNTGSKTKRISKDKLSYTFKAIFYTLLLAIPVPVLFYVISWQLSLLQDASALTYSIALGLNFISIPLFYLQMFYYICFPGGVAEIHFKWSDNIIIGLRHEMQRLLMTFLPIIFLTALLISKDESSVNGGLSRLSLLLTLFTFALFFYRVVKPKTGLLSSITAHNPGSFFARTQFLWFLIGLMGILALSVLVIIGYVYTAGQMTVSMIDTVWLIFAIVLLQQLSVRWLLLTQRKFSLTQAYEKRKEYLEKKNMSEESSGADPTIEIEEPEIDFASLSADSLQLLNIVLLVFAISMLSIIWSDLLPALSIFDKINLWHHLEIVDGVDQVLPVTLSDLSLAIFILILTLVSAKRLPAIIDILLLQNSSISKGNLYTITTLVNYMIIGLGLFTIFNLLGAEWVKLQWLFAALSVGIGFGLQEIVANFISGIIILFERPIRVGDYVSVGDNEGVVSKIRIRATTILTIDRKELLVPNKEFITGQLLNWSLSDSTARLIIPVGVAYGSDINLATKILFQVAKENERVLEDPIPQVLFYSFGDNSLDLQLRCFIGEVDYRLSVISELNKAINEKFNAADINIAFPQKDVHLDIKHPIDVVLSK